MAFSLLSIASWRLEWSAIGSSVVLRGARTVPQGINTAFPVSGWGDESHVSDLLNRWAGPYGLWWYQIN